MESPSAVIGPGTPGVDIFKLANASISGLVASYKTGVPRMVRLPFMSTPEEHLALYLEYHPHVRSYQRGDVTEAFVKAYHIPTPLGTPYRINYVYEGKPHIYLPDFVGTLSNGGLLIAEAGIEDEKSKGQALAKAEAARRVALIKNGVYWIGTEKNLPMSRYYNLQHLHRWRDGFPEYAAIAAALLANWPWGDFRTVRDFLRILGGQWSEERIEAAVWKTVGDAAAEGRLLVDLTEHELTNSTLLALLEPGAPPILPDPLPSSLEQAEQRDDERAPLTDESNHLSLQLQDGIPGPTFDASSLKTKKEQKDFNRRLSAVRAVLAGGSLEKVAKKAKMSPSALSRLVSRTRELGQIACAPRKTYHRDRALRPEFQELIRKLYMHPLRPTIKAVAEDEQLARLAEKLSNQEGVTVSPPPYQQVWRYINHISREPVVANARSGLKHSPREGTSSSSFVLSIPYPALICQVDEHTLDLLVVTQDGTEITRCVHGAVLICVKTGAILGAILALDSLKEEDYMRLVKQALEKKEELTTRYQCKHDWPCYGKPSIIFHDRGKIFTSERATQVLVDRLKITTEKAPPYAPSAKGTVEAIFKRMKEKFEHRLPNTTKSNPEDRGAYDSVREARKAGITLDVLEGYFIRAIVDDYMQDCNKLRRQKPIVLWEAGVRETSVPQWLGSQDDLKLLLMKAVNRKNPATGRYAIHPHQGLSFLGRHYVNPGFLNRLSGKEVDIYYDRRDISVIYLFLEGEFVGEAYCREFMGRPVSLWEANANRKADTILSKEAAAESLEGRQGVQRDARAGRRAQAQEARRLEKQRQLDLQRQEIHPIATQATLEVIRALALQQPASSAPALPATSSLLPPAEPEDDSTGTSVAPLTTRKWEGHHDEQHI
jgi:transposase